MNRLIFASLRRWHLLALVILTLGLAAPVWAQNGVDDGLDNALDNTLTNAVTDAAANAATSARAGTPSFLSAVDTTLRLWSGQFQKLGPYAMVAVALVVSYLTGLVLFQLLFGAGGFAPRAASTAAWVGALVLLFCGLLMLPATWPWWAPYALLFTGLLFIAVLVSTLSKKAV